MSLKPEEISDAEITMDMFRLARDGGYTTAAALKWAIRGHFPDEPQERLDKLLKVMVSRMLSH